MNERYPIKTLQFGAGVFFLAFMDLLRDLLGRADPRGEVDSSIPGFAECAAASHAVISGEGFETTIWEAPARARSEKESW